MIIRKWKNHCTNINNTELVQIVVGFTIGLILAPFSWGFIYFLIFWIIWEILVMYGTGMRHPHYRKIGRLGIICSSFIGWITGRYLILDETGMEFIHNRPISISEDIHPDLYIVQ